MASLVVLLVILIVSLENGEVYAVTTDMTPHLLSSDHPIKDIVGIKECVCGPPSGSDCIYEWIPDSKKSKWETKSYKMPKSSSTYMKFCDMVVDCSYGALYSTDVITNESMPDKIIHKTNSTRMINPLNIPKGDNETQQIKYSLANK